MATKNATARPESTGVVPGEPWQASPGISGIDDHHQYAAPIRDMMDLPYSQGIGDPTVAGPSFDDRAPAQFDKRYWQERAASALENDRREVQNNVTVPINNNNPTHMWPDPRRDFVPVDRPSAWRGPQISALVRPELPTRFEARLTGQAGGFQWTPSLHPDPARFGQRPAPRFRTTQRNTPSPMEAQTVHPDDQQNIPTRILSVVSTATGLERYW